MVVNSSIDTGIHYTGPSFVTARLVARALRSKHVGDTDAPELVLADTTYGLGTRTSHNTFALSSSRENKFPTIRCQL